MSSCSWSGSTRTPRAPRPRARRAAPRSGAPPDRAPRPKRQAPACPWQGCAQAAWLSGRARPRSRSWPSAPSRTEARGWRGPSAASASTMRPSFTTEVQLAAHAAVRARRAHALRLPRAVGRAALSVSAPGGTPARRLPHDSQSVARHPSPNGASMVVARAALAGHERVVARGGVARAHAALAADAQVGIVGEERVRVQHRLAPSLHLEGRTGHAKLPGTHPAARTRRFSCTRSSSSWSPAHDRPNKLKRRSAARLGTRRVRGHRHALAHGRGAGGNRMVNAFHVHHAHAARGGLRSRLRGGTKWGCARPASARAARMVEPFLHLHRAAVYRDVRHSAPFPPSSEPGPKQSQRKAAPALLQNLLARHLQLNTRKSRLRSRAGPFGYLDAPLGRAIRSDEDPARGPRSAACDGSPKTRLCCGPPPCPPRWRGWPSRGRSGSRRPRTRCATPQAPARRRRRRATPASSPSPAAHTARRPSSASRRPRAADRPSSSNGAHSTSWPTATKTTSASMRRCGLSAGTGAGRPPRTAPIIWAG